MKGTYYGNNTVTIVKTIDYIYSNYYYIMISKPPHKLYTVSDKIKVTDVGMTSG